MSKRQKVGDNTLTPIQAARIMGIHPKTVNRMVDEGAPLTVLYTTGGHRRYNLAEVEALHTARLEVAKIRAAQKAEKMKK